MKRELRTPDGALIRFDHRLAKDEAARVVLIHALGMDRTNWNEAVRALPDTYSLIVLDVRGHGLSVNDGQPLDRKTVVADMEAVLGEVGWASAVLVGCSMGGCIALATAVDRPELVDGLTLIDTTAWYGEGAREAWTARADKAAQEGFEALVPFQRERWFSPAFIEKHPEILARCTDVFLRNDIRTYQQACAFLAGIDVRASLGAIKVPVGVVVGSEDYATPVSMASALHDGIRNSRLKVLEGRRHFTPLEAPEEVAAEIVSVVERRSVESVS